MTVTTASGEPGPQTPLPDISIRVAAARDLLGAGDVAAAEARALEIRDQAPHVIAGYVLLARCAAAHGDAALTLARWQDCRERFPRKNTVWGVGLAFALIKMERLAEADRQFAALLEEDPDNSVALAGRALVANRRDPTGADALWQRVAEIEGGKLRPDWAIARARVQASGGDSGRALATVRDVLRDQPNYAPGYVALCNLLIIYDHKDEADCELGSGFLRPGAPARPFDRLRVQIWRDDLEAARASFSAAMSEAASPTDLTKLFEVVPRIFAAYDRGEVWRTMRARVAKARCDSSDKAVLELRLDLALRDERSFLSRLEGLPVLPAPWASRFARAATVLGAANFPDLSAPRVFGIGLSRTGTSSLGAALETLGYFHAHYLNPFSCEILSDTDFALFDAITDIPAAARFERLYHLFPNAHFVLTERPMPSWLDSIGTHVRHWHQSAQTGPAQAYGTGKRHGVDKAMLFGSLYKSTDDMQAAYEVHLHRVQRFFADKPADKLLRFNIFSGDGWPKLCAFLGRDVPVEPFPWNNRSATQAEPSRAMGAADHLSAWSETGMFA